MTHLKYPVIILFFLWWMPNLNAQQNHSMYLMHNVAESNLLNPAIPIHCKWYVGLPVISSLHLNYTNSSFSFNDIFTINSNGAYSPSISLIRENLHWRNLIGTELHAQLLALGYQREDYSFVFTITEKNNIPLTFPKEIAVLAMDGNSAFLGEWASLKGTGIYFNHYREYAVGVSKKIYSGLHVGVRAKLLFGKFNISTRSTNIRLFTDATNFNLEFDGDMLIHSSLPIVVDASNNQLNSIAYNDASILSLLMNRKNPGLALDAGIIYDLNDAIQLSASLLDVGFIRWRSNLNTFEGSGNFVYQGAIGDPANYQSYFSNLWDEFLQSINFDVTQQKYTTFLPPRAMAGIDYQYNKQLHFGAVTNVLAYRTKLIPALTLTGLFYPTRSIGLMGSYTIQNYSLNNLGAGFYLGINPVQFYMISDNILAFMYPLNTRNVNLRFGLNLNFGCPKNQKSQTVSKGELSTCFGMGSNHKKSYKNKFIPWNKRKKNQ